LYIILFLPSVGKKCTGYQKSQLSRQLFLFRTLSCLKLALLRTAFPLLPPNLSELDLTSDNFSSFRTKPVRTGDCFGQLFPFFHQTCPNLALLRTAFALLQSNLSELVATSDSFSASSAKPVRTCGCFGQLFFFSHQTCPNHPLLRITFPLQAPSLSAVTSIQATIFKAKETSAKNTLVPFFLLYISHRLRVDFSIQVSDHPLAFDIILLSFSFDFHSCVMVHAVDLVTNSMGSMHRFFHFTCVVQF
jgi:hypothetical protein